MGSRESITNNAAMERISRIRSMSCFLRNRNLSKAALLGVSEKLLMFLHLCTFEDFLHPKLVCLEMSTHSASKFLKFFSDSAA